MKKLEEETCYNHKQINTNHIKIHLCVWSAECESAKIIFKILGCQNRTDHRKCSFLYEVHTKITCQSAFQFLPSQPQTASSSFFLYNIRLISHLSFHILIRPTYLCTYNTTVPFRQYNECLLCQMVHHCVCLIF